MAEYYSALISFNVVYRAKVVTHLRYVFFQIAEVAVPRKLFAAIQDRIRRLRAVESMAPS